MARYFTPRNLQREDLLSFFVHANELRGEIAVGLGAPAASKAAALAALRKNVALLIDLMRTRVESLAAPATDDSRTAELIEIAAKLQFSEAEFSAIWKHASQDDATLVPALPDLLRIADEMLEAVAPAAVSWKLKERLDSLNSGAAISFHEVTKDWVGSEAIRSRVWQHILRFRYTVPNGLAERSSGLIFKCSENRWRRHLSLGVLILLATAVSQYLLHDPLRTLETNGLANSWKINPWYWWVLGGVALQAAVTTLNGNREQGFPPFSEIRDWIHVREVPAGVSILASMAAAIVLAAGSPDRVSILSAVSTGYALDHLLSAAASRVTTVLGSGSNEVTLLKKRFGL